MIVAKNKNKHTIKFETLLNTITNDLRSKSKKDPKYFLSRGGVKLEKDVFDILQVKAKNTVFERKLELISGQRFPDIVAYVNEKNGLGVEVKTSSQNHWKTTGSSIFENTRVENIEPIYLLFGKLHDPVDFKCKRYEDCLHNVAVTHSPRYLIDMDIKDEATIFNKIGVPYDNLRVLPNPFKPIKKFFRKNGLKSGEDIWWIDKEEHGSMVIRHWSNLEIQEKESLRIEAMCLFPELFSKSNIKYHQLASWLVAKHKIVSPSLRDTFTAGGQVTLKTKRKSYEKIPKIFLHLSDNLPAILSMVKNYDVDELQYYWKNTSFKKNNRVKVWKKLVDQHSKSNLRGNKFKVGMLW